MIRRRTLVTSALPYVNNVPHLGNIVGSVLSADCYARYCRARGDEVLFIGGTDEYGTATETKAREDGCECAELCDRYHVVHRDTYTWFDIAFDAFGRTPTARHTEICHSVFEDLSANGHIQEKTIEQPYSPALGKFLADRYLVGTCPKCGASDARGDQCDACGGLTSPAELRDLRCRETGCIPEFRSTKHLYLDLPRLTPALSSLHGRNGPEGGWSANAMNITQAWMRTGLNARCITRDLTWGVPVPRIGFEGKVFYVWFDAPLGYVSITAVARPDCWRDWWCGEGARDVELVQFMGKDNVLFHTVLSPAAMLGTGRPWTVPSGVSATEHLTFEGDKFSKSKAVGMTGPEARSSGIPADVWRYYLISIRPEHGDSDFRWADMVLRVNSELVANLGNLVNRVMHLSQRYFHLAKVPEFLDAPPLSDDETTAIETLCQKVDEKTGTYRRAMDGRGLREGLRMVMSLSADTNKFLQSTSPWAVHKRDPIAATYLVAVALSAVRIIKEIARPFMPNFARTVSSQMGEEPERSAEFPHDVSLRQARFTGGHALGPPPVAIFQTLAL